MTADAGLAPEDRAYLRRLIRRLSAEASGEAARLRALQAVYAAREMLRADLAPVEIRALVALSLRALDGIDAGSAPPKVRGLREIPRARAAAVPRGEGPEVGARSGSMPCAPPWLAAPGSAEEARRQAIWDAEGLTPGRGGDVDEAGDPADEQD